MGVRLLIGAEIFQATMMKKTEGSEKIKEEKSFLKTFFFGFLHGREGVWKRMKKGEVFFRAKKKVFRREGGKM